MSYEFDEDHNVFTGQEDNNIWVKGNDVRFNEVHSNNKKTNNTDNTNTPKSLNPYLLQSKHIKTGFKAKLGFSAISKDILSSEEYPTILSYFNTHTNIVEKDFFIYLCDNFKNLSPSEIKLINKNFDSSSYSDIVFNHIYNKPIEIDENTFNSLLTSHFNYNFSDIFEQHLITNYAISNLASLDKEQTDIIFLKIDFSKKIFLDKVLKDETPILNKTFWQFFKPEDTFVKDYLKIVLKNKWYKNLNFFFNEFPDITQYYFDNLSYSYLSKDDKFFEQNFIYKYPPQSHLSHLAPEELQYVFSKKYMNMIDKNLISQTNKDFLFSLRNGIYPFLEYIGKEHPQDVRNLFETRPELLFSLIEFNNISNKAFKLDLKQSFCESALTPNIDLILKYKDKTKRLFKENSFIVKFIAPELDNMEDEESNDLIKLYINASFDQESMNSKKLQDSLNLFSYQSLKKFKSVFEISLTVLDKYYNISKYFVEANEIYNKVVLSKKMTTKLDSEIKSSPKLKSTKI